ncbi:MAG TPA: PLP-dependent aminotransferase family protein [Luteimonas sp.]|nr:PLP-dependent aminotransferase family protein [Luteimonas sp.]
MHLQLDGNGPLHAQLTRALKAALLAGVAGGARLPATRQLARELGVSRNTVLAAYEQLRAEGFIDGRIGSGSYVAPQLPAVRPPPRPREDGIAPQSAFARRMRECHDHDKLPGRRLRGVMHAFQYGVPMTNPTLTTAWARELSHAAQYTPPGYPASQGLPALREATCDYLARRRGVHAAPEDVLIVNGTQQAMTLIADVLIDEDDTVAIEEPHYDAIRKVLQSHGARMHTTAVDREGLVCDALPPGGAKLVCVTPSHQFPTGAVMSLRRRMALLEYAARHEAWIFEDDYDGEFRYDGKPLAALRSLDEGDRVIYVGTFSKALFPTLRLGYLIMPPQLRRDFIAAKWMSDFSSAGIEQAALANFIADGGFERHLRRTAQELRQRRATLVEGLRACSRGRLEIEDSQAGMHLVVWLPGRGDADAEALVEQARQAGLGMYSIAPYYLHSQDRGGLLMGYGGMPVAEIEQALALFARCLDEVFPVAPSSRPAPPRPAARARHGKQPGAWRARGARAGR